MISFPGMTDCESPYTFPILPRMRTKEAAVRREREDKLSGRWFLEVLDETYKSMVDFRLQDLDL